MSELLDTLLQQTPDLMCIFFCEHDDDLTIHRMNESACRLFGVTEEQANGQTVRNLFNCSKIDLDIMVRTALGCMKSRRAYQFVHTLHVADNDVVCLDVTMTPLVFSTQPSILAIARHIQNSSFPSNTIVSLHQLDLIDSTIPTALIQTDADGQYCFEHTNSCFLSLHASTSPTYWNETLPQQLQLITTNHVPLIHKIPFTVSESKILYSACLMYLSPLANGARVLLTMYESLDDSYSGCEQFQTLSHREKEVLLLVSSGETNKCIAHQLNISEGTVKKIIYNAYKKLNICSRAEAVRLILSLEN